MPQTARSPKDIEKRVLADHYQFKNLAYYEELLEKLRSLMPSFFEELNNEKENAKPGDERRKIRIKISTQKDSYCMVLGRAWGEIKAISLPEEEDGIVKEVLIEAYRTEFRKNSTYTPSALASVLEQSFNRVKNQKTPNVRSAEYSSVCVRYEAYRAFLKENLGEAEFSNLQALYDKAQSDHSEIFRARHRPAAQDEGLTSHYVDEATWHLEHFE